MGQELTEEEEAALEHTQWWKPDSKARWGTTHASAVEGVDAAISARIAGKYNRVLGQKLTEEEENLHGRLVSAANDKGLSAPVRGAAPSKSSVNTRWAIARKIVNGRQYVKTPVAATGYEGPELKEHLRARESSFLSSQGHFPGRIWSADAINAFLQTAGFAREVFPRAPAKWGPEGTHRVWKLRAPAYGLNDAPVAFRNLLNSVDSLARAGLKFQVSSFGPRLYLIFRRSGGATGAITTHFGDTQSFWYAFFWDAVLPRLRCKKNPLRIWA